MKKTILPDGTVELEGEPEELSKYEDDNEEDDSKNESKTPEKRLLND